jgi:hypothetical protein
MEEAVNFPVGCFKMNHDGSGLCVVWEQRVMHTGGRYTYVKWWVPVSELHSTSPTITSTHAERR